jgi:transposase
VTDQRRFTSPLAIEAALLREQAWWEAAEVRQVFPTGSAVSTFVDWVGKHRLGRNRLLDTMLAAAYFSAGIKSVMTNSGLRLDPVLPLSPGRAERHGFEYFRRGTLSLYAALNTRTGDVLGKTTARHTSAEFVDFLGQIVASQPEGREIHIVADNLSAHKTKNVFEFLQAHPTVRIHYTPTYSSWLNQVEIWFSKIQHDVISRGIFTSTTDLSRKLIRYIKQYNNTATPFRWRVGNADNRIKPVTQRASDSAH